MSIVIGYWSDDARIESPDKLESLLTKASARFASGGAKIGRSSGKQSPSQTGHVEPSRATHFGVAVCGRHATLRVSAPDKEGAATVESLRATLAASGAGFGADVWVEATGDGLVLGRDAFGRATMFWTHTGDAVWFASRLELLLSVIEGARVSVAGFYAYGCFSYVPAPLTPVENISAVAAGTETVWRSATPGAAPQSITRHEWREADAQTTDERAAARSLRRLLEESVAAQLERSSGERVGVFLSGGLDSSITAAMLVRAGARVSAYTLDFGKDCFSEVAYAEQVARALGISLAKIPCTASSVRRMIASTAARLDGLYGDGVTLPLALLCERASKDVGIVFNGEGGDQLFAGWTNKPLIAASLYEHATGATRADATPLVEETFAARYMRTFHRLHGHEASVYTEAARREMVNFDAPALLSRALDPSYTRGLLQRLRRANLMLKGADNIQPRATNLGLSYHLDVRTPFCSPTLAGWTFGVSGELWLKEGCEKYLLKRAVEEMLPREIVWREKRGMGVPLTLWLNGSLRRWTRRQLHRRVLAREGLWQSDLARRISEGELSGQVQGRRIGETLWLMLMWRAWRERVLQSGPQPTRDERRAILRLPLPSIRALGRRYT
ncbi:MAG TPA: asparagine synthetase B family protein [Pyrinomonadaceae bacterium]|jgi:asparagine synthase (glutamine-hydrolysing)|nr:asparagine synthetase B family protein [Pyrinomonadaceae bacterium]